MNSYKDSMNSYKDSMNSYKEKDEMNDPESGSKGKKKKKGKCCSKILTKMFCNPEGYVYSLLRLNVFMRAVKFLPALLITYGIELFNSANLSSNSSILSLHFSLLIFEPVLSAIAGNIGLQTSSSVSSFINLQQQKKRKVKLTFLLKKYLSHNLVNAIFLSLLMSLTCYLWPKNGATSLASLCKWQYVLIVFLSSFANMAIATFAGVFTPFILHLCRYDPSSGAGPFETALQDVLGSILFVLLAKIIIQDWGSVFTITSSNNCTLYG